MCPVVTEERQAQRPAPAPSSDVEAPGGAKPGGERDHLLPAGPGAGHDDDDDEPAGSALGTYVTITKNLLGSGTLTMPYLFSLTGYVEGVLFLLLAQAAAGCAVLMLVVCADALRADGVAPASYQSLVAHLFGPRAATATDVLLAFYTGWSLVAYGMLLTEFFGGYMGDGFFGNPWFVRAAAAVVLVPLCSLPNLDSLKAVSGLGNAAILYCAGFVVWDWAANGGGAAAPAVRPFQGGLGVLQTLPTFAFAFNFHYNVPAFYKELPRRSASKMMALTAASYLTADVVYIAMGIAGSFMYGAATKSLISDNLPHCPGYTVLTVALGLMIACSYPILQFPARISAMRLIGMPAARASVRRRVCVSAGIVAVAQATSAVVPNLGTIVALNGAFFGVTQQLFIPTAMYLALLMRAEGGSKSLPFPRPVAVAVFAYAVVVMVLGSAATITNLATGASR